MGRRERLKIETGITPPFLVAFFKKKRKEK